jgi:hypothetical protein
MQIFAAALDKLRGPPSPPAVRAGPPSPRAVTASPPPPRAVRAGPPMPRRRRPAWRPKVVYGRPSSNPRPREHRSAPRRDGGARAESSASADGGGDPPPRLPTEPSQPTLAVDGRLA